MPTPTEGGKSARISYDRKADALYITLDEGESVRTEEVESGVVMVDRNEKGHVVFIEILLAADSAVEFVER